MAFQNGAYAKIWEFTDKGTYGQVSISTSKKNNNTGNYDTDFQHKFATVAGQAYEFMKGVKIPSNGLSVKIGNCATSNKYSAEKKVTYWNCAIFALEDAANNGTSTKNASNSKKSSSQKNYSEVEDDDAQLPF